MSTYTPAPRRAWTTTEKVATAAIALLIALATIWAVNAYLKDGRCQDAWEDSFRGTLQGTERNIKAEHWYFANCT